MIEHPDRTLRDTAAGLGQCRHRLTQLIRVSFQAPHIVRKITEGKHPAGLTPRHILSAEIPLGWKEQEVMLGVA
jgi:hypothetical protein